MIDTQKCRYILKIADLSSFSKASEELFIAQSSLSRYVNELESNLGLKLFDRTKLPIELTYAGKRYVQYVKEYLEFENRMNDEFVKLRGIEMGNLTIGSFILMGTYILPSILPKFFEKYPHVNINIKNETPITFESSLINGNIDICLINLPPNRSNIDYEIIADDKVLLVAQINHPISEKYDITNNSVENPIKIDYKDIENEKFILLPIANNMRIIAEKIFSDHKLSPKNILEVPNLNMAIDLVSANMGFTFVCESTLKHKKLENPLLYFSVGRYEDIASIILAYKKPCNSLVNSFIDISKDAYIK